MVDKTSASRMHQKFVLFVGLFVAVAFNLIGNISNITQTLSLRHNRIRSPYNHDQITWSEQEETIPKPTSTTMTHQHRHFNNPTRSSPKEEYQPSAVEKYVLENADGLLRLGGRNNASLAVGCDIWKYPESSPYYRQLRMFRRELLGYDLLLKRFKGRTKDVRLDIRETGNHDVCDTLDLVPGGLSTFFKSGVLSKVGNDGGFVEPLLPPLRHPDICIDKIKNTMNMGYIIQDFASLCRKVQPHSRIVFVDMGAALDFHKSKDRGQMMPAVYITEMYQKFGFHFDHIYAFEVQQKDPQNVYNRIPEELRAAYHWFNVGVSSDPDSPNNPFNILLDNFNEDDLIVVKLDIDDGSIENPLALSVLQNDRLRRLIDCFYFEHHVFLSELAINWKQTMQGSVSESLKMFSEMREHGIASHYWP